VIGRLRPALSARRMTLGVALLSLSALALMIAWVVLFVQLLQSDRAMDARVREDAMWAVFQADRNAHTLMHLTELVVRMQDASLHDDLMEAYDILYSRSSLLQRGAFRIDLHDATDLAQLAGSTAAEVHGLADRFDSLDPGASGYLADVEALMPDIRGIRLGLADLTLKTNYAMSLLRVDERAARSRIHDRLGASGAVLVLAFVGIGAMLALQVIQLRRAHQRMAHLRERSRRQAARARAASRAKSTFLATMSHEIRTPLNGIIASAELLGVSGMRPEQARRLTTIRNSGQLLLDVISDVLDYSKLESRGVEVTAEAVDLCAIAELIGSAFATQAEVAGIGFEVSLPRVRIESDAARLRQVIVNLVGNALKFTAAGHVRLAGTLPRPDLLRIEVTDTGIGISAEDQKQIFDEFRQVDGSYARQFGGTGLGLAISRRIVQALGGRIGVDSTPGLGSTFWVELPVRVLGPTVPEEAEAGSRVAPTLPAPESTGAAATRPLRVLVVEDNPINSEILVDLLHHLGHSARTAVNGLEAVAQVAEGGLDIVLMDMQMPVLTGPDATRRIRAEGHRLPIVGVTANVSAEDRRLCAEAGMNDFISKPITLDRLLPVLRRVAPLDLPQSGSGQPAEAGQPRDAAGDGAVRPGGSIAASSQFIDLVATLGAARLGNLLDRFEASLPASERNLLDAIARGDAQAIDTELHTIKGAALTLGLETVGRHVQSLRDQGASVASVADMLAVMNADLAAARSRMAMSATELARAG